MNEPLIVHINSSFIRRYFRFVEKRGAGDCWLWRGAKNSRSGYPLFSVRNRKVHASKVGYVLYQMGIAGTETILERTTKIDDFVNVADVPLLGHSCGDAECVNPQHFTPGIPTNRSYSDA